MFHPGYAGFLKYGPESANISPTATTFSSALPAMTLGGYTNVPRFSRNDGTQGIEAAGSYRDVDTVPGARANAVGFNLTLGDANFLKYGIRGSGVSGATFRCMPILSLICGALDPCGDGGDAFTWAARYAMLNTLNIQFQENQPLTASVEAIAIAADPDAAAQSITSADVVSAGGTTLTWFHSDITIGGVSLRHYISSASISIQNNIKAVGGRKDLGWSNPLSRAPVLLVPGTEKISVNFKLHAKLPPAFASGMVENLVLTASNSGLVSSGAKTVTFALERAMVIDQAMDGGGPNDVMGYSGSFNARNLTITTS